MTPTFMACRFVNVEEGASVAGGASEGIKRFARFDLARQTGSPACLRKLLSNADSGTKRRSKRTWPASFPAV